MNEVLKQIKHPMKLCYAYLLCRKDGKLPSVRFAFLRHLLRQEIAQQASQTRRIPIRQSLTSTRRKIIVEILQCPRAAFFLVAAYITQAILFVMSGSYWDEYKLKVAFSKSLDRFILYRQRRLQR